MTNPAKERNDLFQRIQKKNEKHLEMHGHCIKSINEKLEEIEGHLNLNDTMICDHEKTIGMLEKRVKILIQVLGMHYCVVILYVITIIITVSQLKG